MKRTYIDTEFRLLTYVFPGVCCVCLRDKVIFLEKVKENLVFLFARTRSSSSAVRLFNSVDYFPHQDKDTVAKSKKCI